MEWIKKLHKPLAWGLSLLLAVSCTVGGQGVRFIAAAEERPAIMGDVNGDGQVEKNDLDALRQCMASDKYTPRQLEAGDLDGDRSLTAVDYMLLRKRLAQQAKYGRNEAGMPTYTAAVENPADRVEIRVLGRTAVKAQGEGSLEYGPFAYGDTIEITSDRQYFWVQLDQALGEALIYSESGRFSYQIPSEDTAYPDGIFDKASHTIKGRTATEEEIAARRNLAVNVYDFMYADEENSYEADTEELVNDSAAVEEGRVQAYPHAYANRITENKRIFMARNAIDGVTVTGNNHNDYPYQSWGCGQNDDAEFVLYFGREVELDQLALVLRADFSGSPPHDTYWESVAVSFSDGSEQVISLEEGGQKQTVEIEPVTTTYVRLKNMIRHAGDSQMWAALTELEAYGKETLTGNPAAVRTYVAPDHGGKPVVQTIDNYSADEIEADMKQVYEYFRDNIGVVSLGWKEAVYYVGLMDAYTTTGDLDYYLNGRDTAESHSYMVNGGKLTDFGDDYAISQMYLTLNALSPDTDYKLSSSIENADFNIDKGKLDYHWCDALYMSGMVFTGLANLTGNSAYSEVEHQTYKEWYDQLYDPDTGLWYRDLSYIGQKTEAGNPVFWSRGNAWVFAYLARQLSYLQDTDSEQYRRLLDDFRKMAAVLKDLQRPDGTWNACINDESYNGGKETTGTAGFLYGFAVGVQLGLLERETYLPVALKAYDAMTGVCMVEPGRIGYMQVEDASPRLYISEAHSRSFMNSFGTGLFLAGASALMRMCEDYKAPLLDIPLDSQDRAYSRFTYEPGFYDGPITATASSSDENKPAGAFDHVVSGAKGTRWSANGLYNWLTADLGKEVALYKINVHPMEMRDYQYKIEVSDNGKRWFQVIDRTDNTEKAGCLSDSFAPIYARYVRLTVTGAATYTGGFTSISEMFLYPYTGEDTVQRVEDVYEDPYGDLTYVSTQVTAEYDDSQPDEGYYIGKIKAAASAEQDWENNYAANLFNQDWSDAAQGARWACDGYPNWAVGDLGKPLSLSQITLMIYQGRQYYYHLEVSVDGESWQTAAIITDVYETAKNHTYVFAQPVEARFVRLTVIGANAASYTGTWISINEMLLYEYEKSDPDPNPDPAPVEIEADYSDRYPSPGFYMGDIAVTATREQEGNEASNLFNKVWTDAGSGSRWACDRPPQSATADFGKVLELSQITMLVVEGRQYYYTLELSEDGKTWQTVACTDAPYHTAQNHTYRFSRKLPARYLRLTVNGWNPETVFSTWISINEILLYEEISMAVEQTYSDEGPADGYYEGTVTATATGRQPGNEEANLFNKVWNEAAVGSSWRSYIYPQTITIDFGKDLTLSQITMLVYKGRQYYYELMYSRDDENWLDLALVDAPYVTANNHTFIFSEPLTARYIKLRFAGSNKEAYDGAWINIEEILLYEQK